MPRDLVGIVATLRFVDEADEDDVDAEELRARYAAAARSNAAQDRRVRHLIRWNKKRERR